MKRLVVQLVGVLLLGGCSAPNSEINTAGGAGTGDGFRHACMRPVSEVLGVTHAGGKYFFSDKPYLAEGADALEELGTRVIKIWFTKDSRNSYPYNSEWPSGLRSLADLARSGQMKELFDRDFRTFVLETTEFATVKWKDGLSAAEAAAVGDEFCELTKYLIETYRNSGKTFILQNWEGDNALKPEELQPSAIPVAIQGMIDWLNARQNGVDRARRELGMQGVVVAHCVEVNKVLTGANEPYLVVDRVVPSTHADLYSLSSWGTRMPGDESKLPAKLDYIAAKAPASILYGEKNVMLGEFGQYERSCLDGDERFSDSGSGQRQLTSVRNQLDYALRWGVVCALYWEIYCNGTVQGAVAQPDGSYTNDDLKGVWLIRADATRTPTYNYMRGLFAANGTVMTQQPDTAPFANPQ